LGGERLTQLKYTVKRFAVYFQNDVRYSFCGNSSKAAGLIWKLQ